jgi:hypothetical protein
VTLTQPVELIAPAITGAPAMKHPPLRYTSPDHISGDRATIEPTSMSHSSHRARPMEPTGIEPMIACLQSKCYATVRFDFRNYPTRAVTSKAAVLERIDRPSPSCKA